MPQTCTSSLKRDLWQITSNILLTHLQVGAGGLSRLITWHGSDPALQPVLFASHVDVVPVKEESIKVCAVLVVAA
jgi:acetylornithine deacetylase/succinyl-diaminopimelate desuccinylase-like protein